MIYYLNSKGKKIEIIIKRHAVFSFRDRYEKLFGTVLTSTEAEGRIIALFPLASRVKNYNSREKIRIKRHGHSLYFRDPNFTYVIHNGVMITVEISKKGFRKLNKEI